MHWQYVSYALPLIVAAAISFAVAVFAWRRRTAPGATALALLMLAATEWSLAYALRLASVDLPAKIFWSQVRYVGIVVTSTAWLVFALQYTGRGAKWLTRRGLAWLAVEPLVILMLVWTNKYHNLIWTNIELERVGSLLMWHASHGAAWWVHTVYSYLLILLGDFLIVQVLIRSPRLYREQAAALLIGVSAPLLGNVLSVFELIPTSLDLTPFAFVAMGLALAWAIFRPQLLDIVPVAREAIIEGLHDGLIVLDAQGRVVELNPAIQRIIGRTATEVIGQPAAQALAGWPDLVAHCHDVTEIQTEIVLGEGGTQRTFDLRISFLRDYQERVTGRLVILRDITERKRAEGALRRGTMRLQLAADVARSAAVTHELDELLDRTVNLIQDRLDLYHAGIFLVDERGEYAVLKAATGEAGRTMLERGYQLEMDEISTVGRVTRTGQPRIVLDVGDDAVHFENPLFPETRSEMTLPLQVGGRVIGALDVQSREPAAFDEDDMVASQAVADQLAVFIENARLLQEMEQTMRDLEVASGRYTQESWAAVSQRRERLLGYRYSRAGVEPVAGPRQDSGPAASGDLAVPITLRDQEIGLLNLRSEGEAFSPETVSLVKEVAGRLALAMENARLLEDTRRRAQQEQLLRAATAHMHESSDMETVLKTAANEMYAALGLDEIVIRLAMANDE
ncbi:MAG: GAF domain-containing protein [Anaerolineae bacterium]|nr:GAF domain-containing protein [Anaerolineae bacterium]